LIFQNDYFLEANTEIIYFSKLHFSGSAKENAIG